MKFIIERQGYAPVVEDVVGIIAVNGKNFEMEFEEEDIELGWQVMMLANNTFQLRVTGKNAISLLPVTEVRYKDSDGNPWFHKTLSNLIATPCVI